MRIGVIGCGSIGRLLIEAIGNGKVGRAELTAVAARPGNEAALRDLAVECRCRWTLDPSEFSDMGVEVAVEAAGIEAVRSYAAPLLESGISMVILSVGALADPDFRSQLIQAATSGKSKIYVPSGALGGLDAIQGAAIGGLDHVTLTTRKPPQGLAGAPYFVSHPVDLDAISEPIVIFEGSADEAISQFPANVNVAVALGLAGVGTGQTRVRIIADPSITTNVHEVSASGSFGTMTVRMSNRPSPGNARTSLLTAHSALALIRRLGEPIQIGT